MRWADALKASPIGRATRQQADGNDRAGEPNVILNDPKFPKAPKLFRAVERLGWRRVPLREADKFDDWQPATDAGPFGG